MTKCINIQEKETCGDCEYSIEIVVNSDHCDHVLGTNHVECKHFVYEQGEAND